MNPVRIIGREAACNLGWNWDDVWAGLLRGEARVASFCSVQQPISGLDLQVAMIPDLDREVLDDPPGAGATFRLTRAVLRSLESGTIATKTRLFGASNHGESDALIELVRAAGGAINRPRADTLLPAMASDLVRIHAPEAMYLGGSIWAYSACSSSLHALALAVASLTETQGSEETALVVAADALSPLAVAGFYRAGAIAQRGCAPFDPVSDGLLIGEGAGAIHLGSGTGGSGVTIAGIGMTCDAGHPTLPDPEATQLERAIRKALTRANIDASEVDLVVAHGTGTAANDRAEAKALERVFGPGGVPVTSIKGIVGHCMGAAGLLNLLVAERALFEGVAPATSPSRNALPGVDVVLMSPRRLELRRSALALAAGFGGNNVAVVLKNAN